MLTLQCRQPIMKLISNVKRIFCLKTFVFFRRFIQRYNMKQHIKTHRIEMLADQKTSFPMGKKGRHANISHSYGSSYHHEEQVALDMSN